jgi:putative transposase
LHPAPGLPPGPLKRFRIAFLPAISRTLRRDGIVFEHLRYWHPIFSQWLARRERLTLHFDPRNLFKLYVPQKRDYLEVPFSDLRMPGREAGAALNGQVPARPPVFAEGRCR